LSQSFLAPTPEVASAVVELTDAWAADQSLAAEFAFSADFLQLRSVWSGLDRQKLQRLQRHHFTLFVTATSGIPCPPFESAYMAVGAGDEGRLLATIERDYATVGLYISPEQKQPPDHISIELEFMAIICGREAEAWEAKEPRRAVRSLEKERRFLDQQRNCASLRHPRQGSGRGAGGGLCDERGRSVSPPYSPENAAKRASPDATSGALVLLCGSLRELGNGLDLDSIAWWLEETKPGTRVVIVPELCTKPKGIADAPIDHPGVAVLGLCSSDYRETEFQRSARKVGIDPLAVAAVNVGSSCAIPLKTRKATAKAKVLLAAATARVQQFPGSAPENVRPYILGDDQKISRRALFTMPPIAYRPVAAIDAGKCAADKECRACVEACPTDALTSVNGRIEIARRRCDACGICESVCPTSAASLPGQSLPQVEAEVTELLSNPALEEVESRSVLFVCQRSAGKIDSLAEASLSLPDHWLPVTVPCAGSVSPTMLLQSLACGATTAGVLGCGKYCEFGQQEKTNGLVDYCRSVLESLGRSPERARFFDAAGPSADLAKDLSRSLPVPSGLPVADTPVMVSFSGPEAAAQAIIALATDCDPTQSLSLSHPSSPLGLATLEPSGCTGCGACTQNCPTGAFDLTQSESDVALTYDPTLCTGCAQCVTVCPEHVVQVGKSTDIGSLREGRTTLYEDDTVRCESCGAAVGPAAMLRRIEDLMSTDEEPGESTMAAIKRLCPTCRAVGVPLPGTKRGTAGP
jgi:ferredoxin/TorA maturation chaperone TorD